MRIDTELPPEEETNNAVKKDAVINFLKTASPSQIFQKIEDEINPGGTLPTGVMRGFKLLFLIAAHLLRNT